MMQAVAALSRDYQLPCQVSLEERMACGIGVCLVCACQVMAADGAAGYQRCCVDGPVFDAEVVVW
jgi:dihydroorotate dehydrogenase electron transfer subunit